MHYMIENQYNKSKKNVNTKKTKKYNYDAFSESDLDKDTIGPIKLLKLLLYPLLFPFILSNKLYAVLTKRHNIYDSGYET
jgi:hypothetical protein